MVRRIKDRARARFHLALSEVGAQDTWQRAVLGFALVGTERERLAARVGEVVRFIESMGLATVAEDEREILRYGEPDPGADLSGYLDRDSIDAGLTPGRDDETDGPDADWIPESWKHEGASDPEAR